MRGIDGTVTIRTAEYRPCMVGGKKAIFHRWESPVQRYGCENPRELPRTMAIIELESGEVKRAFPEKVRFLDTGNLMQEIMHEMFLENDGEAEGSGCDG